jgi:hypothetical protein
VEVQEKAFDVKELAAQRTEAGVSGKSTKAIKNRISTRRRAILAKTGVMNLWHRLRPAPLPTAGLDPLSAIRIPRTGGDLFTDEQVKALADEGVLPQGVLGDVYGRVQGLRLGKEYHIAHSNLARCREEAKILVREIEKLRAWVSNMDARCKYFWKEQHGDKALRQVWAPERAGTIVHGMQQQRAPLEQPLVAGLLRETAIPQALLLPAHRPSPCGWASMLVAAHAKISKGNAAKPGLSTFLIYQHWQALKRMRKDLASL